MHSIIRTERSQPYSFRVMLHGIYVTIKPNPNWSELFAHAREAPTNNKTQDDDSYTVPRRISSRAPRLRPTLARVYILSLWLFFWCVRCGLVRFAGRYQLPVFRRTQHDPPTYLATSRPKRAPPPAQCIERSEQFVLPRVFDYTSRQTLFALRSPYAVALIVLRNAPVNYAHLHVRRRQAH